MSDRLLAEAWRDLAGDAVGMVTSDGFIVVDVDGAEVRVYCPRRHLFPKWVPAGTVLPALDSPANWGHWLAWCCERFVSVSVVPQAKEGHFAISVWGKHRVGPFAATLLRVLLESWTSLGLEHPAPPSVLAWWKSQQGETS